MEPLLLIIQRGEANTMSKVADMKGNGMTWYDTRYRSKIQWLLLTLQS